MRSLQSQQISKPQVRHVEDTDCHRHGDSGRAGQGKGPVYEPLIFRSLLSTTRRFSSTPELKTAKETLLSKTKAPRPGVGCVQGNEQALRATASMSRLALTPPSTVSQEARVSDIVAADIPLFTDTVTCSDETEPPRRQRKGSNSTEGKPKDHGSFSDGAKSARYVKQQGQQRLPKLGKTKASVQSMPALLPETVDQPRKIKRGRPSAPIPRAEPSSASSAPEPERVSSSAAHPHCEVKDERSQDEGAAKEALTQQTGVPETGPSAAGNLKSIPLAESTLAEHPSGVTPLAPKSPRPIKSSKPLKSCLKGSPSRSSEPPPVTRKPLWDITYPTAVPISRSQSLPPGPRIQTGTRSDQAYREADRRATSPPPNWKIRPQIFGHVPASCKLSIPSHQLPPSSPTNARPPCPTSTKSILRRPKNATRVRFLDETSFIVRRFPHAVHSHRPPKRLLPRRCRRSGRSGHHYDPEAPKFAVSALLRSLRNHRRGYLARAAVAAATTLMSSGESSPSADSEIRAVRELPRFQALKRNCEAVKGYYARQRAEGADGLRKQGEMPGEGDAQAGDRTADLGRCVLEREGGEKCGGNRANESPGRVACAVDVADSGEELDPLSWGTDRGRDRPAASSIRTVTMTWSGDDAPIKISKVTVGAPASKASGKHGATNTTTKVEDEVKKGVIPLPRYGAGAVVSTQALRPTKTAVPVSSKQQPQSKDGATLVSDIKDTATRSGAQLLSLRDMAHGNSSKRQKLKRRRSHSISSVLTFS